MLGMGSKNTLNLCLEAPLKDRLEAEKCNYLMICVGQKGQEIYKTFSLTADEKKKLDVHYQKPGIRSLLVSCQTTTRGRKV